MTHYEHFGIYILNKALLDKKHSIKNIMIETKIPMPILKNYLLENHEISDIDLEKFSTYLNESVETLKMKRHEITKYKRLNEKVAKK